MKLQAEEEIGNVKMGQMYEYQEGGKRNKQKRSRNKQKAEDEKEADKKKEIQLDKAPKEDQDNEE